MSQLKIDGEPSISTGELTGVPLGATDALFAPFAPDSFGMRRRALTEDGLRLSLELARMAYTLDVEPWMRAGWTDFSVQVDNQLTTGVKAREDDSFSDRISAMVGSLRLALARRAMKEHNPLAQVTGALRQREESDTLKAIVMVKPAPDGRFVLAIGFMGTGRRFYDWFSNLRVGMKGGFHKGFHQLTQGFIKNEEHIVFPDTAAALGLKRLTLSDIFAEMRGENSRFSLWMAGHSQGAAVMQVYSDHLLEALGLPSEAIFGCGFASPTVAADSAGRQSAAYPLYHVLNTEDVIPRMGSLRHFGLCLQYTPDAAFRAAAYDWSMTPAAVEARRQAQVLTLHITDTLAFLQASTALLTVICEEKTDEAIFGATEGIFAVAPVGKMVSFAGRKAKDTLYNLITHMRKAYQEIHGQVMDEAVVGYLMKGFRPIVRQMPVKKLLGALYDQLYPPHSLCRGKTMNGAYIHIVNEQRQRLKPFVWEGDGTVKPYRRYALGYYGFGIPRRKRRPRPNARRLQPRRRGVRKPR
ncbi:MAG TPA: hypothetical protein PKU80_09645 [Candidatus Limiplasma sp.]|nr:hypothetical protein [Candidatus Limiplasma sp.]HRX07606.1 hypothetical protein [Candidatus Limiplasma sp.]